jgi:hypothetical protein
VDAATINGCWQKTLRADALCRLLNKKWRAFVASDAYRADVEQGSQTGCYRAWIEAKAPPPLSLSVIVGEIAHDLRSALDHLVYRQAIEHVGLSKAKRKAHKITFPICDTPAAFGEAKALRYISEDTRALVEQYQPYERGDGYLAMVHWFNRLDKHRAIHPASAFAEPVDIAQILEWNPAAELLDQRICLKPGERLEGRADIVWLRFASGADPDVKMKGKPPLAISFGDAPPGLRGVPIAPTVQEVQRVIRDFRNLLR